ncbi:ribosomal protein L7/L12 [Gimesia algae]|uniref:50S ribosomal protein L7/L12 n=1 Tax=Gimesia algae TaxID=2527971 RepID=A0A517V8H8_9PLAN|nr:ribosomal protein L7/L12 [Gimesia algae]QDT89316.1 50S ribosomal protein L7/L12 [Gimesia algae]
MNDESQPSASGQDDAAHDQSEVAQHILESLRQGNKIQAIKDYRESTGEGLKESKEAIEALIEKYDIQMKSGCASMLLLAGSLMLLLIFVWIQ